MQWLPLIILTGVFYGVYNFFIKLSSGHINQIVGVVILQLVAAAMGLVLLTYLKLNNQSFEVTSKGVVFAVFAGVFVGLAEIISFLIFSKGAEISSSLAIIVGATIVTGAILGIFILKESVDLVTILGMVFVVLGISFITLNKGL